MLAFPHWGKVPDINNSKEESVVTAVAAAVVVVWESVCLAGCLFV